MARFEPNITKHRMKAIRHDSPVVILTFRIRMLLILMDQSFRKKTAPGRKPICECRNGLQHQTPLS